MSIIQYGIKLVLTAAITVSALYFSASALAIDCPPPPPSGNYVIADNCSFDTSESGGVNGVDGGKLIISRGKTLTVNGGQTIVFPPGTGASNPGADNSQNYNPGPSNVTAIKINSGGQVKPTFLWMQDSGNTGYPDNFKQIACSVAPGAGGVCGSSPGNAGFVRRSAINIVTTPAPIHKSLQTVLNCSTADSRLSGLSADPTKCWDATTGSYNQNSSGAVIQGSARPGSVSAATPIVWAGFGTALTTNYTNEAICKGDLSHANSTWNYTSAAVTGSGVFGIVTYSSPQLTLGSTLAYGSKYYYCYIAQNSYGIYFGDINSGGLTNSYFITPPKVNTHEAVKTPNQPAQTRLSGDFIINQPLSTRAWFVWGTSGSSCEGISGGGTVPATSYGPFTTSQSFMYDLSITPGTTYKYCAVSDDGAKVSNASSVSLYGYGALHTFTPHNLRITIPSSSGYGYVNSTDGIMSLDGGGPPTNSATVAYTHDASAAAPVVTLTAWPNPSTRFTWSGCGSINGSNQCVVTMNAAANVTATFIQQWTLSATVNPSGAGSASGQTVDAGQTATATASATNSNYYFSGWGSPCNSSGQVANMSSNVTCQANFTAYAPTLSFTASPTSITAGNSSTLSWSTSYANSCSGFSTATSGSSSVSPNSTTTYTLNCSGSGGSISRSVTVTVTQPAPTLSFSGSPTSVNASTPVNLSWNSTNASSCTASGSWSGTKATSGGQSVYPSQRSSSYSLYCSGPGGTTSTQTVNVTLTCTARESKSRSCPY